MSLCFFLPSSSLCKSLTIVPIVGRRGFRKDHHAMLTMPLGCNHIHFLLRRDLDAKPLPGHAIPSWETVGVHAVTVGPAQEQQSMTWLYIQKVAKQCSNMVLLCKSKFVAAGEKGSLNNRCDRPRPPKCPVTRLSTTLHVWKIHMESLPTLTPQAAPIRTMTWPKYLYNYW